MIGREFLTFAAVGTVGFVVDAGALLIASETLGLGPYVGRLLSFLMAATFTWAMNRRFTFVSAAKARPTIQLLKFIAANAVGGLVNVGLYAGLVFTILEVRTNPVLGVACGSLAGLSVNFLLSRLLVFRTHPTPR